MIAFVLSAAVFGAPPPVVDVKADTKKGRILLWTQEKGQTPRAGSRIVHFRPDGTDVSVIAIPEHYPLPDKFEEGVVTPNRDYLLYLARPENGQAGKLRESEMTVLRLAPDSKPVKVKDYKVLAFMSPPTNTPTGSTSVLCYGFSFGTDNTRLRPGFFTYGIETDKIAPSSAPDQDIFSIRALSANGTVVTEKVETPNPNLPKRSYRLFVSPPGGEKSEFLFGENKGLLSPQVRLSRNGEKVLVYWSPGIETDAPDVHVVDLKTKKVTAVTGFPPKGERVSHTLFSTDANRIAYVTATRLRPDSMLRVYTADLDGSNRKEVYRVKGTPSTTQFSWD